MEHFFQEIITTLPFELNWISSITFVLVLQFVRVTIIESRIQNMASQIKRQSSELNDETALIHTIGNKMDDLSDFIRNKVQLKKEKDK